MQFICWGLEVVLSNLSSPAFQCKRLIRSKTGHLEEAREGASESVSVCDGAEMHRNLGGSEAEGGGGGVRLLPVLQHHTFVFSQGQVVTGGQVAQAEGLPPPDVTPTPAVKDIENTDAHTETYTYIEVI